MEVNPEAYTHMHPAYRTTKQKVRTLGILHLERHWFAHGQLTVKNNTLRLYLNASVYTNGHADVKGYSKWGREIFESISDSKLTWWPANLYRLSYWIRLKQHELRSSDVRTFTVNTPSKSPIVSLPWAERERIKNVDRHYKWCGRNSRTSWSLICLMTPVHSHVEYEPYAPLGVWSTVFARLNNFYVPGRKQK
jgi:hypothetical protein